MSSYILKMAKTISASFQQKNINEILNNLLQEGVVKKILELNEELKIVKTHNRPPSPDKPVVKNLSEFREFYRKVRVLEDMAEVVKSGEELDIDDLNKLKQYELEPEDVLTSLEEAYNDPMIEQYQKERALNAWRRYKSPDYKRLEEAHSKYKKLVPYSYRDSLDDSDIEYLKEEGLPTTVQGIQDEITAIETTPYFDKLKEKKELASRKYRLPPHVSKHIRYILQQITCELLEHALESAYKAKCKTCRIDHIICNGYEKFSTYPLFRTSVPFQGLFGREFRKNAWYVNRRADYNRISRVKDPVNIVNKDTFEEAEKDDGKCRSEHKIIKKKRKNDNGEEIEEETQGKLLYKWYDIELAYHYPGLESTINRISTGVKKAKKGDIVKMKVGKDIKNFIAAIVSSVLDKIILSLQNITTTKNKHAITFSADNLNFVIRNFLILGGDGSYGKGKSHYDHLILPTPTKM